MTQATCREEYINTWNEYIDGMNPAMWEVKDDDDREDMKNCIKALKIIIAKSGQRMQDEGNFD